MSKESYARGFAKVASEAGLDASKLMKYAANATPFSDYALSSATSSFPFMGMVNSGGYWAGLLSGGDNSQKSVLPAAIPGVGGFRIGNRIKTQVLRELRQIDKDKKNEGARPVAHAVAEHIGPATSILASMGAGAGIGHLIGKHKGGKIGILIGGGVGAAATLVAALAAAIKRRRTKEEQIESDKESVLKKYLIPGTAVYDYSKRLGRSQGERDEASKNSNGEKKAESSLSKEAQGEPGLWDQVKGWLEGVGNSAKEWWQNPENASLKPLVGTGIGILGGGALSSILGDKFGRGAILGGLAGAGSQVDWKALADSFGKKK